MQIIYVVMFLSLWSLGLFFLFHRTRSNFWIGLTIVLGGSGSYTFAMHLSIMPVFQQAEWMHPLLSLVLYQSTVVSMNVCFYILPYVFCMGGLWLNERMSRLSKWIWSMVLLLGVVLFLGNRLQSESWNYFEMSKFRWWVGAYIALGCIFYVLAYVKEKNQLKRSSQRRTLLFPIVMIWAFFSDYVGIKALRLNQWSLDLQGNGMWHANFIVILSTVMVVLFFTIRYGFLGIKLKIERERIDYSIRTLTMGVAILNHSIKNEIQKIDYLTEKSTYFLKNGQSDKAAQTIEQVHGLTSHLLNMVNRIKEKAEDVHLDESVQDIKKLIESVIISSASLAEHKQVSLSAIYIAEGELLCDAVHVKETLSNLIRNAIDAMPAEGGAIVLRTYAIRREFRMEVKDNGGGIPSEYLSKIFEPFFTTKKNALNYGLGLSYCTSVMSKHGGKLSVAESAPGQGTTIVLHFPGYKYKSQAGHSSNL